MIPISIEPLIILLIIFVSFVTGIAVGCVLNELLHWRSN